MKFLRDWLRVERPAGVAPHASQTLEVARSFDETFELCIRGIEDVLGGVVRERDHARGTIEASFGLINSERLTCVLTRAGEQRTRVEIVSRRGASPQPAKPSPYIHALAQFLQTGAR